MKPAKVLTGSFNAHEDLPCHPQIIIDSVTAHTRAQNTISFSRPSTRSSQGNSPTDANGRPLPLSGMGRRGVVLQPVRLQ
jgi:hypothetical protein